MHTNKLLSLFLLLPILVLAQQSVPISKVEVLEKVQSQNHNLKIGEQEVLSAQGDYRQTNAVFLPNIRASHTGMSTTNPLMAFGFKLNQEVVTQADFDPNSLNNPSKINMFATKLEVEQPIFNLDGIHQRKAAKAKWDATQLQLDRTEDYMVFEAEKAYMQLQVAYKSVEVLQTALKAAEDNLRMATNSFDQGYLQRRAAAPHADV